MEEQYVVLELGKEKYALRIQDICEIIKLQKITEVPNSKAFLEGVINLRGRVIPVISLRKRFNLETVATDKFTRIVVVNSREETIGIVVDRVHQVTRFSEIQAPTETASAINESYIEGIGLTEDGLISILKIEQVLYE